MRRRGSHLKSLNNYTQEKICLTYCWKNALKDLYDKNHLTLNYDVNNMCMTHSLHCLKLHACNNTNNIKA